MSRFRSFLLVVIVLVFLLLASASAAALDTESLAMPHSINDHDKHEINFHTGPNIPSGQTESSRESVGPQAPSSIKLIGSYTTPATARGVAVVGNYAYVANDVAGLRIINVANPATPTEVGFYDTPGSALGVAVVGNYAYVADEDAGLRIVNVSNPAAPTEVGFYRPPGYSIAKDIAVVGNYAYVADYVAGLRIINVANPAAPTEVGFYDTPGYTSGVAVVGNYAYVADIMAGLRIINVANPTAPAEVGSYAPLGSPYGAAVAGNYAYVAGYYIGLRIINVANPTAPIEVGFYDTPGAARGIAVVGNYAYVADESAGLRIINVANPAAPIEVDFYDTPTNAMGVAAGGNYVYIADGGSPGGGELLILEFIPDLTPPTNPTTLTSSSHTVNIWSNDNTVDVAWSGARDDSTGIDGYSLLWDNSASTVPDTVKDVEQTVTTATSPGLTTGNWYFHIRTVDNAGNWTLGAAHLGPFKIDATPPTSLAFAPEFAISPFEVQWRGIDVGSGVANYDVWVRDGLGGSWTPWQIGTSAVNATFTDIITGHTYYFRSQAHDVASNLEVDLPVDGDTHTTIAAYQVTGQVTNNRAQPVFNATVSVAPTALNTAKTSGDGSHTLFFGGSGVYTLTVSRAGFGVLSPRYDVDVSSNLSGVDFVLPPLNDVVSNGGWESGDSSGWSIGAGLTTTVEMIAAHTGHYGVRLNSSGGGGLDFEPSITQSVMISAGWSRPTLSWLCQVMQANPGDALLAVVSNGSTSITATVPITIGAWQHDWLDLSAFSGQAVTLEFGFQTQTAGQQIDLDEISVGDSAVGVYPVYLPLIRRNS